MDIKLWESDVPFYIAEYEQPEPSLTAYLCGGNKKRGCVIVMPGGGYQSRCDYEGEPVSLMLNGFGINSFVLNYRVQPYTHEAILKDAQRAIRLVRARADEYNIIPEKIAVLGFSAGGHLAISAAEHFDYGNKKSPDSIERVSSRPDAAIPCYPVVTLKQFTNGGTTDAFLGNSDDINLLYRFSCEENVRDDTPPMFIWHTANDNLVDVRNSIMLASSLKEKNIPFELHIFPFGVHGLGLAQGSPSVSQWNTLLKNWLLEFGY